MYHKNSDTNILGFFFEYIQKYYSPFLLHIPHRSQLQFFVPQPARKCNGQTKLCTPSTGRRTSYMTLRMECFLGENATQSYGFGLGLFEFP